MADRKKDAYRHTSEIAGGGAAEERPSTEHQDLARGDAEPANEIREDERAEGDGYGPRTHEATRVTRKDAD
ncbi:MAG: hypothetical protein WD737_00335 [Gemmatimonadota bacterium]